MNSASLSSSVTDEQIDSSATDFDPFSQAFVIGEWQVDPRLNQLLRLNSNERRHLEPRLAKLLCFLASQPMEVVDRDTLVSVLWPRVIVNENSLTRAVSELRKLLSQDADSDRIYIETIPKRGYRLSQAVNTSIPLDSTARSSSTQLTAGPWRTPPGLQRLRESAVAAICLAFTLALLLQGYQPAEQPSNGFSDLMSDQLVYSSTEQQLRDEVVLSSAESAEGLSKTKAVMSQDGERFAYIQYDHTGSTLFLGEAESSFDPVPVFNSADLLYNLAWSPLQDALLFASKPTITTTALYDRDRNEQAKLYSFDLESFRLSLLVEQAPTTRPASDAELSLT